MERIENNSTKEKIKVYAAAIIYSGSVGFSFYGIKMCVPYGDTLTILSFRYLWALIGALLWIAICIPLGFYTPPKEKHPKKNLYLTAGFYVLFMILQIFAMFFATSIEGAIVFAAVPIVAKLIARIFLGEKSTALQNVFVGITVSALILMIILNATDTEMSLPGIIIMFLASVCLAISNVFMRYVRGVFKPIEITLTISVMGFVVFNCANVIRHIKEGTMDQYFEPFTHPQFTIWIIYLGIFCILLSAQFVAYMMSKLPVIQTTIWGNVSTAISILAGALLLGEPLQWFHILCAILIIGGVIGLSVAPPPKDYESKSMMDE